MNWLVPDTIPCPLWAPLQLHFVLPVPPRVKLFLVLNVGICDVFLLTFPLSLDLANSRSVISQRPLPMFLSALNLPVIFIGSDCHT